MLRFTIMKKILLFLINSTIINIFLAGVSTADGFWSRDTEIIKHTKPQASSQTVVEDDDEVNQTIEIKKHRSYTSAHDHIMGLLYKTLPTMPGKIDKMKELRGDKWKLNRTLDKVKAANNIDNKQEEMDQLKLKIAIIDQAMQKVETMDGIMQEVAGLLFHSTPLSSPTTEIDPQFKSLEQLEPGKLNINQAYGFRDATETQEDEELIEATVFWAVYLGAYLRKNKSSEVYNAESLIKFLKLGDFNSSIVEDEQGYIEHVSHLLRFVGIGSRIDRGFSNTKYNDKNIDPYLISHYDKIVKMAIEAYDDTISAALRIGFAREYNKSVLELGIQENKHYNSSAFKAILPQGCEKNEKVFIALKTISGKMCAAFSKFKVLKMKDFSEATVKKIDEISLLIQKATQDIEHTQNYMRNATKFEDNFSSQFEKEKDIKKYAWKQELEALYNAKDSLKLMHRSLYQGKEFELVEKIHHESHILITRRDIISNLLYIAKVYGSLEEALRIIPDYIDQLVEFYNVVMFALDNKVSLATRLLIGDKAFKQKFKNTYCHGREFSPEFTCSFVAKNHVYILPELIYDFKFSRVKLTGVWPPEMINKEKQASWENLHINRSSHSNTEDISDIDINTLPNCWQHLRNLEGLYTSSSVYVNKKNKYRCSHLPEDFKHMKYLWHMKLCSVGLKSFPDWIGQMSSLGIINIRGDDNVKPDIKQLVAKLPHLQNVYLA